MDFGHVSVDVDVVHLALQLGVGLVGFAASVGARCPRMRLFMPRGHRWPARIVLISAQYKVICASRKKRNSFRTVSRRNR